MPTPSPVGSLSALNTGLVLKSQAEIDGNEFGLEEAHLKFVCLNSNYPAFVPARATAVQNFPIGDALTRDLLIRLSYLGMAAQTHRFTRGRGGSAGVGVLEVVCQGAIFNSFGLDDNGNPNPSDPITIPFTPHSTTQDNSTVLLYPGLGAHIAVGHATTTEIGAGAIRVHNARGEFLTTSNGSALPDIDGDRVPVGGYILVKNQSNQTQNGIYLLLRHGGDGFVMRRIPGMDEPSEVNNSVYVNVKYGSTNAGTVWQCNNTGAVVFGTTAITFSSASLPTILAPTFQASIDYHAIDLHFEYMAANFAANPRFIQNNYVPDSDGLLTVDPTASPPLKLAIQVDRAIGQRATQDPTTFAVTIADAPQVALDRSDWINSVLYLGTSARFEQTPAGRYWHVLETTTIKIMPILLTAEAAGVAPP